MSYKAIHVEARVCLEAPTRDEAAKAFFAKYRQWPSYVEREGGFPYECVGGCEVCEKPIFSGDDYGSCDGAILCKEHCERWERERTKGALR